MMTQWSKHVTLYKGNFFNNNVAVLTIFVVTIDFTQQDVISKYYKHIFWTNEFVAHFSTTYMQYSLTSLRVCKILIF